MLKKHHYFWVFDFYMLIIFIYVKKSLVLTLKSTFSYVKCLHIYVNNIDLSFYIEID
jgi:hypothetical protein